MDVNELIAKLQELPGSAKVVLAFNPLEELEYVGLRSVKWYMGPHSETVQSPGPVVILGNEMRPNAKADPNRL